MKRSLHTGYKPSGAEWLGDIPEHWEVKRLKHCASINDEALSETTPSDFELAYVDISSVDALLGITCFEEMVFEDAPSRARRMVREGDIIISTVRTYLRAIAPISKPRENLVVSTGFAVVRPRRIQARFLSYALSESGFVDTIMARSVGVSYPAINAAEIGTIPIAVPSDVEQRVVADFLDRAIEKIDSLASKKRTLVDRLKEKRTALISQTVTRGLPPDVAHAAGLEPHPKLKPSGIDWLGDVPAHWDIVPLRYQFRNLDHRRIPVAGEDRASIEKLYPYYGASGIIDYVDEYLFDETLILVAEDGANLLSRSTPLAFLAFGKYWVNNHAHILKPLTGDIRYWVAVLSTFDYTPLVTGAAQPKLTSDRLGDIRLPKPSLEEQRTIAEFLDRETGKIDRMIAKVETAVECLQEYRSALITAAVTGKIDVRETAILGEKDHAWAN